MNLHANPTAGEKYHHEYTQNREEVKAVNQVSILDTYGGAEYLKKPPKELVMGQTESYVEYSRTGQVIKGKERAKARSKYVEDRKWLYSSICCYIIDAIYRLHQQPHASVGFVLRR